MPPIPAHLLTYSLLNSLRSSDLRRPRGLTVARGPVSVRPRLLALIPHLLDQIGPDQAIQPRSRRNQRCIHVFITQLRLAVRRKPGDRGFQPFPRVLLETIAPLFSLLASLRGIDRKSVV